MGIIFSNNLKGETMSRLWHRLKNNVLYYYSVVDVLVSGFLFHFIHFLKTGKFPQKRARYSQDEILEEIRKIAQELQDNHDHPSNGWFARPYKGTVPASA